jgi:hypothetical protein
VNFATLSDLLWWEGPCSANRSAHRSPIREREPRARRSSSGNGVGGSHHGLAATAAHSREAGYIYASVVGITSSALAGKGGS